MVQERGESGYWPVVSGNWELNPVLFMCSVHWQVFVENWALE